MKTFLFLTLILFGLTHSHSVKASALPLRYSATIEIRKYDPKNYPHFELVYKKENVGVVLKQLGDKPGLWFFDYEVGDNYYFSAKLFDFKTLSNQNRIRLDYSLGYLHQVSNGTQTGVTGLNLCESRLTYSSLEGLKVLETYPAEAWCTGRDLLTVGISIKKIADSQ